MRLATALAVVLVPLGVPAAASAASLSIDVTTPDRVEQHAFTVGVTGTADAPARVYAFVEASASGGGTCAATALDEYNRSGAAEVTGTTPYGLEGEAASAGAIGVTHDYIPDVAGAYLLCAYLGTTSYGSPMAAA
jgi:hypothetical protein